MKRPTLAFLLSAAFVAPLASGRAAAQGADPAATPEAASAGTPAEATPVAPAEAVAPEGQPAVEPDVERDVQSLPAVGHDYSEGITLGLSVDPRSYARDWLVAPPGYNVGGEMRFITAMTAPTGERIRMTDMAILRLRSRWTATKRIELAGSIDFLAKQLDSTDEPIPQGGSLGAKIATSRNVAIAAGVSGGPTLGADGYWGTVGTSAVHRSKIERFISFQVGGGASATAIDHDLMGTRPWQADATMSSELVFHTPRGEFASWAGVDMAFPIVHSDAIDPSSRLDLTLGMVYSAVRDWDLYAEVSFRDRGTTDMPETILPIADSGFDQKQFVVGIARRFTPTRGTTRWALAQD